eukprot:gene16931-16785_t
MDPKAFGVTYATGEDLRSTWEDVPEIHSGYLTKQGGKWLTWKKRWFSVRGNQILYFKEQGESKPLGAYPLDKDGVLTRTVEAVPKPAVTDGHTASSSSSSSSSTTYREHSFIIKGKQESQRTFYLCAPSAQEM